jgi:putative chitinase
MNRKTFYSRVRASLFGGKLNQEQVTGMEAILNEWDRQKLSDLRHLAYMMATVFHETGKCMVPVREGFAASDTAARRIVARRAYGKPDKKTGHVYYGRGPVQLTWADNYKKMGKLLGLPLYEQPDLALKPDVGTAILFEGMLRGASLKGDFTGKSLEGYFTATKSDWVNARRIINGTDKAELIAGYAKKFHSALS